MILKINIQVNEIYFNTHSCSYSFFLRLQLQVTSTTITASHTIGLHQKSQRQSYHLLVAQLSLPFQKRVPVVSETESTTISFTYNQSWLHFLMNSLKIAEKTKSLLHSKVSCFTNRPCNFIPCDRSETVSSKAFLTLILYVLLLWRCENLKPVHFGQFILFIKRLLAVMPANRQIISITQHYLSQQIKEQRKESNGLTNPPNKIRPKNEGSKSAYWYAHKHTQSSFNGGHMSSVNNSLLAVRCFIHEREAISTHELSYFSTLIYSSHVRRPDNRGKLPEGLRRHHRK